MSNAVPNKKFGHQQNVDKVWKSKRLMDQMLQNYRNANLDSISKILLSDDDVEYLNSINVQTISLAEHYSSTDEVKNDLGNVQLKSQTIGSVSDGTVLLKPYKILLKRNKNQNKN